MNPCQFDLPLAGNDFSQFYAPHDVFHPGIDLNKGFGNQDCGNEVRAARSGTVVFANLEPAKGHGFGIFVIVKHDDGSYTRYAHLKDTKVKTGTGLVEGEVFAHVGKTGTDYCHLHFEVFGEALAEIQRAHFAPWCFYPGGKSEAWVRQHYLNPWEWLKVKNEIPEWAKSAADKALKKGIIIGWSNPAEIIGGEKLEWILEHLNVFDKSKHEGRVTLSRFAVALEKLNLI